METKSRTEYSAMNTTVAVISRMTAILMISDACDFLRIRRVKTMSESTVCSPIF